MESERIPLASLPRLRFAAVMQGNMLDSNSFTTCYERRYSWRPCHTIGSRCIVLQRHKRMLTFSSKAVFTVEETHGRTIRAGNRLIANSQDAGWRSLHAAIIEEGPFTATEPAIGHPMLIYHLTRPTEVSRKIEGGPGNRQLIGPRRICLTPGEATTRWEHHGHPEILQVYLRGSIYQAAVSEIYNCDTEHAELVPRFAILDPMLEQLAIAITTALRDGTAEDG